MPDEQWRNPQPHPSSVKPSAVEDTGADYHWLVNSVERHTKCSSAYCLRQKNRSVPAECGFGFPKGLEEETHFNYELLPHYKIGAELVTKRNYHRLNSHNRVMLDNWRANVHLQHIVDKNACARYMAKYAGSVNHAQSNHQRFWAAVCQGYRIMIFSYQESHNSSSWRSRYGSARNSTHASKHAFDRVYL